MKLLRTKKKIIEKALNNPYQSLRNLCDSSFYYFVRTMWDTVSQDEYVDNWHIKYLCEELEKIAYRVAYKQPKKKDTIINIPPGMTKTLLCSIMFPAWCWTKWFWMRFITCSYSNTLALEAAEYSRDLIKSDLFQVMYPEIGIKQDKDTKSNFRVIKKIVKYAGHAPRIVYGGNRFSTSVGGTLTGFHGHILIVDDPLNPNKSTSEVELETANRWTSQTLSTRKTDKRVTPTIFIMQRLHENDPAGYILSKKRSKIHHICLPGQIRDYHEQLQPKEVEKHYEDGLLDTNRLDWDVLEDLESDLGQYGFSGQIGQKPTPPGGGMFKVDHFRIIERMPSEVNIEQTIRAWDKAGTDEKELKKGKDAAYTAGVKIHKLVNGKWLISDVVRGRWSSEEREEIMKETAESDGLGVSIWMEQEPGSGGKESAQGSIRNLAGFKAYAECSSGDKASRADPYSVQVNNGNVLVLNSVWNKSFLNEHEDFPFSRYKDQVDAAAIGFNKLTSKKIAKVHGKKK